MPSGAMHAGAHRASQTVLVGPNPNSEDGSAVDAGGEGARAWMGSAEIVLPSLQIFFLRLPWWSSG